MQMVHAWNRPPKNGSYNMDHIVVEHMIYSIWYVTYEANSIGHKSVEFRPSNWTFNESVLGGSASTVPFYIGHFVKILSQYFNNTLIVVF